MYVYVCVFLFFLFAPRVKKSCLRRSYVCAIHKRSRNPGSLRNATKNPASYVCTYILHELHVRLYPLPPSLSLSPASERAYRSTHGHFSRLPASQHERSSPSWFRIRIRDIYDSYV
ncbi:hypothetical protein BZA05DRAFT_407036 [Tricharina praecox]|uniref:uncharacterized protein n=1 Tax=Tricharina praecox TaxID=43433 RepID=UPI00222040A4|nr:uncharacterized protein BZA05DRAFT_407036 [Tricharina praecox]KAI5846132.1 hypothetical protein BZA05DRAFT_407036 [Tricharina praecox]